MTSRVILFLSSLTVALLMFWGNNASAIIVDTGYYGFPSTSVTYLDFNGLSSTGGTEDGVAISFSGDSSVVTGSGPGYVAPVIADSSGTLFGDSTVSGSDATQYVCARNGSVVLTLSKGCAYMGLLWGTVDTGNTIYFYGNGSLLASFSALPLLFDSTVDGNASQYVNIYTEFTFDQVEFAYSSVSFEFDNVALATPESDEPVVPEPATLGLIGLGLSGFAALRRRRA